MMRPVVGATLRWIAIAIALLAAFDPVFWVHHANIDRNWAEWQDVQGIGNFPAA